MFSSRIFLVFSAALAISARAQAVSYTGKVVDRAQKGLPGALIKVASSSLSTLSGADGSFVLNGNPTGVIPVKLAASRLRGGAAYRGDGRLVLRLKARGVYLSRPEAATPAPLAKTAATHTLFVSKAGYVTGQFRQFSDNGKNLTLSVYPYPEAAAFTEAKKACLDTVNALRQLTGLNLLTWSTVLEAFADSGAHYDSDRGVAHGHFGIQGKPLIADAENELPGWGYNDFAGSMVKIVQQGTRDMWNEGPGGGHYENIKGSHTSFGCGLYINAEGDVWVTQDFR